MPGHDGTIFLAIQFRGIETTVRGPPTRALEFARQIAAGEHRAADPDLQARPSSPLPDPLPARPSDLLALSAWLSAASVLSS